MNWIEIVQVRAQR